MRGSGAAAPLTLATCLVCIAVVLVGCGPRGDAAARSVDASLESKFATGADSFDFASATFPWERMFIFGPRTGRGLVEAALGIHWPGIDTALERTDDVDLVVFVQGGRVTHWCEHRRNPVALDPLVKGSPYDRASAAFRFVRDGSSGRLSLPGRPASDATAMSSPPLSKRKGPVDAVIREVFRSLLETVSVGPAGRSDDGWSAEFVQYRLVGCPVLASTCLEDTYGDGRLTKTGFIPPITDLGRYRLHTDRMEPGRFRELLRAYSTVTTQPFGALEYAGNETWVVTAGFLSAKQYWDGFSRALPGYVFSYPVAGRPTFLSVEPNGGEDPAR